MKVSYYPGCTLKSKAKNFEASALAALKALGVEVAEIERWNCCGAVYSLSDDDLIHQVAPVRDLIRAKEQGSEKLVTLCAMCYNTLARANLLMKSDEEKRDTINRFMDEEIDYFGEVEVLHLLNFLRDQIGWDTLRQEVKVPLTDLKVTPYYGCTLQRPREVGIEPVGSFQLMTDFLEALGATVVDFSAADLCCGSYQILGNAEAAQDAAANILNKAGQGATEVLITSCPLCEYNLGKKQEKLLQNQKIAKEIPTLYFTQLLALALGLTPQASELELNAPAAAALLQSRM